MCEYRNSAILFTTLILYFISVAITSWNVIFLECYIYKLNLKSFKFQNAKKKCQRCYTYSKNNHILLKMTLI